ncbi:MAG: FtsH protease activity modulator HflK [Deltaproteobacteria bacterium]|nr:FtsH protease activity modulator HflK [Deltaproteobacteria bacterium]
MAWGDDDSPGGPWKRQQPPDPDEIIRKIKEFMSGSGLSGVLVIAVLVGGLSLFSCFYSIQAGEVGIVQRFGRFVRIATPGLNFKFPAGIEKVTKVKEQYVYTEEFGVRTVSAGVRTTYSPERQYLNESLMLTGDLNCALVPWIVQYRIGEPDKYLFKVRNVSKTLRDLSEAIMRQVVGDRSINEVITHRLEIAAAAKRQLQEVLNDADTGIVIANLELKKTTVPEPVQPSFNEVNQATQEKEKMIYQAREKYNKVIPEAKGEAERKIKNAEGYALERINRAKGDASRFLQQWESYSKAKDVTRRRLYLEVMGEVLPKLGDKYIIDPDQSGLLPLLNLGRQGGK